MPAHNSEQFLDKSIISVIDQSEQDWELIIIDDGSTDRTRTIAKQYAAADSRISVLALKANGGAARARNLGIAAASGTWITLLDADDSYDPERLKTLTRLAVSERASVIVDNQFFIVGEKSQSWRTLFGGVGEELVWLNLNDLLRENRLGRMFNIGLAKPFIEAALIKDNNLKYLENVRYGEDYLMLILLCISTKRILAYKKPLYNYRYRSNSSGRSVCSEDLISLRDGMTMYLGQLIPNAATSAEIEGAQVDIAAFIQSQVLVEQAKNFLAIKLLSELLLNKTAWKALYRRILLKFTREILVFSNIHPYFIDNPHKMHTLFDVSHRCLDSSVMRRVRGSA